MRKKKKVLFVLFLFSLSCRGIGNQLGDSIEQGFQNAQGTLPGGINEPFTEDQILYENSDVVVYGSETCNCGYFPYISVWGEQEKSIIWFKSKKAGNYKLLIGGSSCNDGVLGKGQNANGTVTEGFTLGAEVLAEELPVGSSTLRLCLDDGGGYREVYTTTITRIDEGPKLSLNPTPGGMQVFSSPLNISIQCTPPSGISCTGIVYTLDGSIPSFDPPQGILREGNSTTITLDTPGVHILRVRLRDEAGHISPWSEAVYILKDPTQGILYVYSANGTGGGGAPFNGIAGFSIGFSPNPSSLTKLSPTFFPHPTYTPDVDIDTSTGYIYVATARGLYLSLDQGKSFSYRGVESGLPNKALVAVVANNNLILVQDQDGVFYFSEDRDTFTPITPLPTEYRFRKLAGKGKARGNYPFFFTKDFFYLGTTGSGLQIYSLHNSTSYNRTTSDGLGSNTIKGIYAEGNNVYVATTGGFSRSTDGGNTFSNDSSLFTTGTGIGGVAKGGSYLVVWDDDAPGEGLRISSDNGTSFGAKKLNNTTIYDVIVNSAGEIFASTGDGLQISTDGGSTFSQKTTSHGLNSNVVYTLSAKGSLIAVSQPFSISISTNSGGNFFSPLLGNVGGRGVSLGINQETPTATPWIIGGIWDAPSLNRLYIYGYGGIGISADEGATFTQKNFSSSDPFYYIRNLCLHGGGKLYAIATPGEYSVHYSSDLGATFTSIGGGSVSPYTLACNPSSNYAYAGGSAGNVYYFQDNTLLSTWNVDTNPIVASSSDGSKVYFQTSAASLKVYTSTGSSTGSFAFSGQSIFSTSSWTAVGGPSLGLRITTNGGSTWQDKTSNLPTSSVYFVGGYEEGNATYLYVGTSQGLSISTDTGNTFQNISQNLYGKVIYVYYRK